MRRFVADESRDISELQEDDTLVFKLAARYTPLLFLLPRFPFLFARWSLSPRPNRFRQLYFTRINHVHLLHSLRCVPVSVLPSGAALPPGARITDGILSSEVLPSPLARMRSAIIRPDKYITPRVHLPHCSRHPCPPQPLLLIYSLIFLAGAPALIFPCFFSVLRCVCVAPALS